MKGGGSNVPAQKWLVIVTFMNGAPEMQTIAGAGVTLAFAMMPGNAHFPAWVTANCGISGQAGEEMAAHRAVTEAVDCNTPFVQSKSPASSIARHKGIKMPAINANSTALVPLLDNARPLNTDFLFNIE